MLLEYFLPFRNWIYDHETLFSSFLAVVAAIITIVVLFWQTKQANSRHKDELDAQNKRFLKEREQKFMSVRSLMPLALSSSCEYAESALIFAIRMSKITDQSWHECKFSKLNDDVTVIFQQIIEYDDEDLIGNDLSELVAEMQIHNVRMRSLTGNAFLNVEITNKKNRCNRAIYDSARLFLHISAFFAFSRFESQSRCAHPSDDDIDMYAGMAGGPKSVSKEIKVWN